MVDEIPISGLLDGDFIRKPSADKIIEQDSVSYKSHDPPNLYHITSLEHAEFIFGTNLEIPSKDIGFPDIEKVTIVMDNSFALSTKGFKLGTDSVLEMYGASAEITLDTTLLTEPLFQQTNPLNDCRALLVHDIFMKGNNTQPFCKLKGTSRIFLENCRIEGYKGSETEFPFTKLDGFSPVDWEQGLVIKNPSIAQMSQSNLRQLTSKGLTFISFVLGNPASIIINNNSQSILFPEDSLYSFDPNAPIGTNIKINGTSKSTGEFYQKGYDFPITSVTDNNGIAVFNSDAFQLHGKSVGDKIILDGFSVGSYNGEFFITVIDSTTSFEVGVTFIGTSIGIIKNANLNIVNVINNGGQADFVSLEPHNLLIGKVVPFNDFTFYDNKSHIVTAIPTALKFQVGLGFSFDDTGIVTTRSLDQTSSFITAKSNPGEPNSMIQGEYKINQLGIEVISSPTTPVPLVDITPEINNFIPNIFGELFKLNTVTGEWEYLGTETIRITLTYTISAAPASGGNQLIEFALSRDNGSGFIKIPNTSLDYDTAADTLRTLPTTFFNIFPGDKLQLFKIGHTTTNNTTIFGDTQITILGET